MNEFRNRAKKANKNTLEKLDNLSDEQLNCLIENIGKDKDRKADDKKDEGKNEA